MAPEIGANGSELIISSNRVTDHRIKLTLHKLDTILDGVLDELIDPLIRNNQARKLSMVGE